MKLPYKHDTLKEEKLFGSQPTEHMYADDFYSCSSDYDIEVSSGGDVEVGTNSKPGKVYFIRHGESTANEANVYSGVTDVSLTKFGIRQAQSAGEDLKKKGIKPDVLYTSHLTRTRKTAAVALKTRLEGVERAVTQSLRRGTRKTMAWTVGRIRATVDALPVLKAMGVRRKLRTWRPSAQQRRLQQKNDDEASFFQL